MNGLDVAIGLSCLAAFVGGYRSGLLARVASWIGMFLGLLLAAKNLGALSARFSSSETRSPGLVFAILVGGAVLGRLCGAVFGRWVQRRLPTRPLRSVNRLAGGALGLAGVLATVWLMTPLLAFVPGWPADATRGSLYATTVANDVPLQPDVVGSVRRLLASGRLPKVLTKLAPAVTGTPPPDVPLSSITTDAVARSVRLVSAVGCGIESDGTAFAISSHRLVTNAHVVAGAANVSISAGGSDLHPVRVIAFDPSRDLAVLESDTTLVALPLAESAKAGSEAAVFGHPGGGELRVAPAAVQSVREALGRDIYDDRESSRSVLELAAALEPGDSGAPVVNRSGSVIGVAFAVAPDAASTAYALSVAEVRALLDTLGRTNDAVSLGRCLTS